MSLDLYREDLEKQEIGSPCYVAQMTFYVARCGTKKAIGEMAEIREKLYGIFPKPSEVNEHEIIANWLAYYGVVNWENVTDDENGEEMEFTPAFSRQLFLNESYWMSLNTVLITHAANYENYLSDEAYKDGEEIKKP